MMRAALVVFLSIGALPLPASAEGALRPSREGAPYPPSRVIGGVQIDWSTHHRDAVGSDNFMMTWADDDHQYGLWGDGGGFGGDNRKFRVHLGVARIEGPPEAFSAFNRFGHRENSEHEADIRGKSWGIVAVDGILYAWIHPDPPEGGGGQWSSIFSEARLFRSADQGASWQPAPWAFTAEEDGLVGGNILQFGRDYTDARDRFVYHYLVEAMQPDASLGSLQRPGRIVLLRVPKDRLFERDAYEVYAGVREGRPRWSSNLSDHRPILDDPNGVGVPIGISYHPDLKRYLLCTQNTEFRSGNWSMFEAAEPWGSWSTVLYLTQSKGTWFGQNNDGPHEVPPNTFFWHFLTKWMEGRDVSLNFTGGGRGKDNDSFNTVRVRLLEPAR